MTAFEPFHKQPYLNLETFRKSGTGVRTPVWFVQDGETIYIRTIANSGKVKRIRNNGQVNIAPCKVDGALLDDWISAVAREINDAEIAKKTDDLLDKKYSLMKKMFGLVSTLQGRKDTISEIKLGD